jgi:hypothetical protein
MDTLADPELYVIVYGCCRDYYYSCRTRKRKHKRVGDLIYVIVAWHVDNVLGLRLRYLTFTAVK